ncbi:MAG: helix-turn-helix domain-containing protein [Promethearchaeota archaeon]|nr:MAG: helix-turn-helix domain-containing protein [Candidatus Lokiarchaeota archaeon]
MDGIKALYSQAIKLLHEAGFKSFYVNKNQQNNRFCYDFIVKKKNLSFILKFFKNIDNIKEETVEGIKILSKLFNASPLLIGLKNRYQEIEDNTIYIREELPIITIGTLKNILKQDLYPFILVRRGGGIVFLNGELMKKLREARRISRKELSEQIGVTKRTICSYESENMRPSKEIADKIQDILDHSEIFRNINVLDWKFECNVRKTALNEKELSPFENHIQGILDDIGISSYWYKKGYFPFEMCISSKKENLKENHPNIYPLLSEVSEMKKQLKEKTINDLQCLKQLLTLFHKHALFIVDKELKKSQFFENTNIPVIDLRDLEKISNEKQFRSYFYQTESDNESEKSKLLN